LSRVGVGRLLRREIQGVAAGIGCLGAGQT